MEPSIGTFTGKIFYPLNARAEDVCIEDIAHALSQKVRYTGHCHGVYTVAQHSVLVSRQCKHKPFDGLMHDSTEAYLPDVAKPIKHLIKGFEEIEDRLFDVIAKVFGLQNPMPEEVHYWDKVLLKTEYRDLMTNDMHTNDYDNYEPLPEKIEVWIPERAKQEFLHEFHYLQTERS